MILTPDDQDALNWASPNNKVTLDSGVEVVAKGSKYKDSGRWSNYLDVTFQDAVGDFWQFAYEQPATEMQDVELEEVVPYRVDAVSHTIMTYVKRGT